MQFQLPRTTGTLLSISDGPTGVRQTLNKMREIVRESVRDPQMVARNRALSIVRGLPSKDFNAELVAVYDWVTENIRFVRDIRGLETLQTPARTIELGAGDCDDQAIVMSALLECLGFSTRFMAVGFRPGIYSHVFTEVQRGSKWIPLETTVPGVYIGWYPPAVMARMVRPI